MKLTDFKYRIEIVQYAYSQYYEWVLKARNNVMLTSSDRLFKTPAEAKRNARLCLRAMQDAVICDRSRPDLPTTFSPLNPAAHAS